MPPTPSQISRRRICVGIDLGTSSSTCSYIDPLSKQLIVLSHGSNKSTIPSIVHYSPNSNEIIVGSQAQAQAASYPKSTIFASKRLIGLTEASLEDNDRALADLSYGPFDLGVNSNGQIGFKITQKNNNQNNSQNDCITTIITPTNIATQILNYFKSQIELQTSYSIAEVVITVPAYFTPDQRSETAKAAQDAGLKVLRLIPEPTAAALSYVHSARSSLTGSHLKDREPDYILVYDFGGGTLDCSLVRQTYNPNAGANMMNSSQSGNSGPQNATSFDPSESNLEVLATAGDPLLGGTDLDNDIMKWCVKQISTNFKIDCSIILNDANKIRRLRQICKDAKERLSQSVSVDLDLDDLYNRQPYTLKLTRPLFQTICKDTLKRAFNPIKQVLQDSKIDKSQIKDVVLVGGSSRIPLIQDQLKKIFNFNDISQLSRTVNPDECVAKGAALYAATLTSFIEQKNHVMMASCANSFPLTLCYRIGQYRQFIPLIKLNTPLPTKGSANINLDCATLRNLDPATLRITLFQVPIDDPPTQPPTKQWVDDQFQLLKPRMFKRWALPIEASVSNFGDNSPYTVKVHYQIDENGIMDIFFEDCELNIMIDVSLNRNTTTTAVKEQLSTQQKTDVLNRYQIAQKQEQTQRLPVPPPPTTKLNTGNAVAGGDVSSGLQPGQQQQRPQESVLVQPPTSPTPTTPTISLPSPPHSQITPQMETPKFPPTTQSIPESEVSGQKSPPQTISPPSSAPSGPPPIPSHINQKLLEQLKGVVQVRDDMIIQLQEQIFALKNYVEKQNNQISILQNNLQVEQNDTQTSIYTLQKQLYDKDKELKRYVAKEQGNIDEKLEVLTEPSPTIESKIALATFQLTERLNTIELQYSQLYDHYDELSLENQQRGIDLEQQGLELRDVKAKYEHSIAQIEKSTMIKSRLENQIEQLEVDLEVCQGDLIKVQYNYDELKKENELILLKNEKNLLPERPLNLTSSSSSSSQQTNLSQDNIKPSTLPPPFIRQTSSTLFTSEEQGEMLLNSMPPLPPIAPSIFSQPIQSKHLPPPPRVRPGIPPTPMTIGLPSSGQHQHLPPPSIPDQSPQQQHHHQQQQQQQQYQQDQISAAALPPPLPPHAQTTTTGPIAPPAPPIPIDYVSPGPEPIPDQTVGGSGRSFLAELMAGPKLKHIKKNNQTDQTISSQQTSSTTSNDLQRSGGDDSASLPPARPRMTLLSQIQLGQKALKTTKKETTTPESDVAPLALPGGSLIDDDLMGRIAKLRSQVADDEEEEVDDEEDW